MGIRRKLSMKARQETCQASASFSGVAGFGLVCKQPRRLTDTFTDSGRPMGWCAPVTPCCECTYKVEPAVGFEPTTDGLQNRCSTTELSWRYLLDWKS